jgi:purine-cytosine permease-like protein
MEAPGVDVSVTPVTYRCAVPVQHRYPNFVAFIATGAVLGFVIGSAFAYFGDSAPGYSMTTSILFLGVAGACVFGLIAALVAVLMERRD